MGNRNATATIVAPNVTDEELDLMTCAQARQELRRFCQANGYTDEITCYAFALFEKAASQPGDAVVIYTTDHAFQTTEVASATHNAMEAITGNLAASTLATVAFDLSPGTHFVHSMRDDACLLTALVTNEPIAASA